MSLHISSFIFFSNFGRGFFNLPYFLRQKITFAFFWIFCVKTVRIYMIQLFFDFFFLVGGRPEGGHKKKLPGYDFRGGEWCASESNWPGYLKNPPLKHRGRKKKNSGHHNVFFRVGWGEGTFWGRDILKIGGVGRDKNRDYFHRSNFRTGAALKVDGENSRIFQKG